MLYRVKSGMRGKELAQPVRPKKSTLLTQAEKKERYKMLREKRKEALEKKMLLLANAIKEISVDTLPLPKKRFSRKRDQAAASTTANTTEHKAKAPLVATEEDPFADVPTA
jgi:hypothetical protein